MKYPRNLINKTVCLFKEHEFKYYRSDTEKCERCGKFRVGHSIICGPEMAKIWNELIAKEHQKAQDQWNALPLYKRVVISVKEASKDFIEWLTY